MSLLAATAFAQAQTPPSAESTADSKAESKADSREIKDKEKNELPVITVNATRVKSSLLQTPVAVTALSRTP